jgi:hypothetical protein
MPTFKSAQTREAASCQYTEVLVQESGPCDTVANRRVSERPCGVLIIRQTYRESFDSSETVTSEPRQNELHTAPGWSWVDV